MKLRDINDNPPQIDRLHETVVVDEDARVGTILETFRAKDPDQRGRSKVTFMVDRSSDPDRQFTVTEDGVVTIQRPLDREAKALHVVSEVVRNPWAGSYVSVGSGQSGGGGEGNNAILWPTPAAR